MKTVGSELNLNMLIREYNPDDASTKGPVHPKGDKPPCTAQIASNMLFAAAGFKENVTISYAQFYATAEKRSFWRRVEDEDGKTVLERRRAFEEFRGLDQDKNDPYFHFLVRRGHEEEGMNYTIGTLAANLFYVGGKRQNISSPLKEHLLQFDEHLQVVLDAGIKGKDPKKNWRFCLTKKPLVVVGTKKDSKLLQRSGEKGLQLQYQKGEWFYPSSAIEKDVANIPVVALAPVSVSPDLVAEMSSISSMSEDDERDLLSV